MLAQSCKSSQILPGRLPRLPSTLERICVLTSSQLVLERCDALQATAHAAATAAAPLMSSTLVLKLRAALRHWLQAPQGVLMQKP
jgi:hypothetical protein